MEKRLKLTCNLEKYKNLPKYKTNTPLQRRNKRNKKMQNKSKKKMKAGYKSPMDLSPESKI